MGPRPPVASTPEPTEPELIKRTSDPAGWIWPSHMRGRDPVRVAMLLPLGAKSPRVRELANSMLAAAELAVFNQDNPNVVLLPKDTSGTPQGAEYAAQQAINQGAKLILGPLFASSVETIAPLARSYDVPVIAFSTDRNVAGNGIYLLSFLPENEVDVITRYAVSQGRRTFAGLYPEGDYGERVAEAFFDSIDRHGGALTSEEFYERKTSSMFQPVKRLTSYSSRAADLEMEKQLLRQADDEASQLALERLEKKQAWAGSSFQAVLLPEEGNLLRSLAPLLPFYGVDSRRVKFLGTGLWDSGNLGREPALVGGWFAAPSPETKQGFTQPFKDAYGEDPPRLASLAYDGIMLASTLARQPSSTRFSEAQITNPNGFYGVDGLFRFFPEGHNERGLAIFEVTQRGVKIIEPAPTSFETIGF